MYSLIRQYLDKYFWKFQVKRPRKYKSFTRANLFKFRIYLLIGLSYILHLNTIKSTEEGKIFGDRIFWKQGIIVRKLQTVHRFPNTFKIALFYDSKSNYFLRFSKYCSVVTRGLMRGKFVPYPFFALRRFL